MKWECSPDTFDLCRGYRGLFSDAFLFLTSFPLLLQPSRHARASWKTLPSTKEEMEKDEEDVVLNDWLFVESYSSMGDTMFGMLSFASRLGIPFWGAALSNMILPRERHSSRCLFLETV
ncbi:uncharacterized protein ARMOST_02968 [Armillaria ostoyae]|uniref:Uncharacterized protein n=1 Tax=Armillaria ostoyae TaxID=47428 RepID=A0A284QT65_ARMOS|nr:uncharacterized protein ARMOST_02968 [Armillaria ostoyae]